MMYKCKLGCGLVVWDRDAHMYDSHATKAMSEGGRIPWPTEPVRPDGMLAKEWNKIKAAWSEEKARFFDAERAWESRHDSNFDEIEIEITMTSSGRAW